MADLIRAKVEAGEYASESEIIRDGLRVLIARDRAVERWLSDEAAGGEGAMKGESGKAGGRKAGKAASGKRVPRRPAAAAGEASAGAAPKAGPTAMATERPSFEFGRMQVGLGPTGRE